LLESYGSKEDSRQQYDVLVPLETPMARLRGIEFGILVRHHQKLARGLGHTGLSSKITKAKVSTRPFGPRHFLNGRLPTKTTQMSALLCGPRLSSAANASAPLFRPFDVRLVVYCFNQNYLWVKFVLPKKFI